MQIKIKSITLICTAVDYNDDHANHYHYTQKTFLQMILKFFKAFALKSLALLAFHSINTICLGQIVLMLWKENNVFKTHQGQTPVHVRLYSSSCPLSHRSTSSYKRRRHRLSSRRYKVRTYSVH